MNTPSNENDNWQADHESDMALGKRISEHNQVVTIVTRHDQAPWWVSQGHDIERPMMVHYPHPDDPTYTEWVKREGRAWGTDGHGWGFVDQADFQRYQTAYNGEFGESGEIDILPVILEDEDGGMRVGFFVIDLFLDVNQA